MNGQRTDNSKKRTHIAIIRLRSPPLLFSHTRTHTHMDKDVTHVWGGKGCHIAQGRGAGGEQVVRDLLGLPHDDPGDQQAVVVHKHPLVDHRDHHWIAVLFQKGREGGERDGGGERKRRVGK